MSGKDNIYIHFVYVMSLFFSFNRNEWLTVLKSHFLEEFSGTHAHTENLERKRERERERGHIDCVYWKRTSIVKPHQLFFTFPFMNTVMRYSWQVDWKGETIFLFLCVDWYLCIYIIYEHVCSFLIAFACHFIYIKYNSIKKNPIFLSYYFNQNLK
jgi:hypothetical protein